MINPEHFERCMNIAFSCMFLLYATMGGFAYLYFGRAAQVLITGNLNEASSLTGFVFFKIGSFTLTVNEAVTVLVAMSAYTTIPALVYVLAELLVDVVRGENASHVPGVGDLIARIIVLALGYFVAITAYNLLGTVESVVGGLCSMSVSLLLPSLFYFRIYKKELSPVNKAVVLGMCVFGAICVVGIPAMNILQLSERWEFG
jgi:vesicular inhibitory amino acid transporter